MTKKISKHYNKQYATWQLPIGEFGGWAMKEQFAKYINKDDVVIDFGCGGGWILKEQNCKRKIGIEVNPKSIQTAKENGIEVYRKAKEIEDGIADVIISCSALEHTLDPYEELKELKKKLKVGGRIIFFVPCESIRNKFKEDDINNHLYSFTPANIGNLFNEVGFAVFQVKPYYHKWIPRYWKQLSRLGRTTFDFVCTIWGLIDRRTLLVKCIGFKVEEEKQNDRKKI